MSGENTKKDGGFTRADAAAVVRVIQGILFGLFMLGVAMMFGDASAVLELPFKISPLSFTITIYGLLGMLACELFAWRLSKHE